MHELYIENINFKIKNILKENVKQEESYNNLKNILISHKDTINIYSNKKFNVILTYTSAIKGNTIKFPIAPVYQNGKAINFRAIKLYIEKYIEYNNLLETNKKRINRYKEELITYNLYARIINDFNNKVIDKIIYNNYAFTGIPSFGTIFVIQNYNERLRVNWGESNKLKEEILERGGIPYIKADAEKDVNYKGEHWLSYHPSLDFFLHWHIKWITRELNPFIKDYMYKPARGVKSIVSKLQEVKNDRERALTLYTRTLN